MKHRSSLARAEAAYAALRRAVGPDGRQAALRQLARAHRAVCAEAASAGTPTWLIDQLTTRMTSRPAEVVRTQLAHEETNVDRKWLDKELADAVVGQDLDRLQELADYAKKEDPDTARDIHGTIIKPHQDKWAG